MTIPTDPKDVFSTRLSVELAFVCLCYATNFDLKRIPQEIISL